jgi:nitrogenase molybdenum-iron protein NifN
MRCWCRTCPAPSTATFPKTSPTTLGGATLDDIRGLGACEHVIAIGEQMRGAVERLEAVGVPCTLFDRLTGLTATDALVALLMRLSGKPAPARLKRQRGQLQDAMLDGHFHLGGKRVAIGAEPDLLFALSSLIAEMGGGGRRRHHHPLAAAGPGAHGRSAGG